jgi:hypothetical protein
MLGDDSDGDGDGDDDGIDIDPTNLLLSAEQIKKILIPCKAK